MTQQDTGRTRGTVALVLALVTLAAVIAAVVYAATSLSVAKSDDGSSVVSDEDRAKAKATAEQFCLRMDTRDAADTDAYKKSVSAVLTTKFKAAFEKDFEQFDRLVGFPAGVKSSGEVFATGITSIDADSATVLVVHDSTLTSKSGSGQQHYRWEISLDKVGGRWLVDDYTPVS